MRKPMQEVSDTAADRNLVLFYANCLLTLLAGNMLHYTMVILARDLSGSDSFTGIAFFGLLGPTLLLSFYAGLTLDRVSRKGVLFGAQLAMALNCAAFALFLATLQEHSAATVGLLVCCAIHGSALAFLIPARFAFLGNLVEESQTGKSTMVVKILMIVSFGLAPAFVGVLKERLNNPQLFAFLGGLFAIAYVFLIPVRYRSDPAPAAGGGPGLRDGFQFLRDNPVIAQLLIATFIGFFLVGPIQVLLPEFARSALELSETGRGAFMGVLGIGLLIGGLAARFKPNLSARGLLIIGSTSLTGAFTVGMAGVGAVWQGALLLGAVGLFGGLLSTLLPAAIQELTPDPLRGRVMAVYSLVFQTTPAISGVFLGLLSESWTLRFAILTSGLVVIVGSLLSLLLLRGLRRFK